MTPPQLMELDAQITNMVKEASVTPQSLQSNAEDLEATPEKVAELKEEIARLEAENKAREEKLASSSLLLETDASAEKKGILKGAFNLAKKAVGAATGAAANLVGGVQRLNQQVSGDLDKYAGQRYEDCMACRFVWKQVEMDVSNAKYVEVFRPLSNTTVWMLRNPLSSTKLAKICTTICTA